jgi:hypothetical protein
MKVVTLKDIPNVPMEGAEPIPGYTGPVSRSRQTIIQPGESANYNCSFVNFGQGCVRQPVAGNRMVCTILRRREMDSKFQFGVASLLADSVAPLFGGEWRLLEPPKTALSVCPGRRPLG